jgi:hypothetical protein
LEDAPEFVVPFVDECVVFGSRRYRGCLIRVNEAGDRLPGPPLRVSPHVWPKARAAVADSFALMAQYFE